MNPPHVQDLGYVPAMERNVEKPSDDLQREAFTQIILCKWSKKWALVARLRPHATALKPPLLQGNLPHQKLEPAPGSSSPSAGSRTIGQSATTTLP